MSNRSKLVRLRLRNIGCVGDQELVIELDNIVSLVGRNNVGKSTVLKAYELAYGSEAFSASRDLCQWSPEGAVAEVQLEVHIPDGIANIDPKWKMADGDLSIVRSRWQWQAPDYNKIRSTWDPQANDWADDGNASGADNVFKSRLPKPLRIGSLQDVGKTEETLLALVLSPLVETINREKARGDSELTMAIDKVFAQMMGLGAGHQEYFNKMASRVSDGFKSIFPRLDVSLKIAPSPLTIDVESLIRKGSGLEIKDGKAVTSLAQQGTGARRALFWAMLQVHNEIKRESETRQGYRKQLMDELKKVRKPVKGQNNEEKIAELEARLSAFDDGGPIPTDENDPALPGYLLLIDEPENALHPMAARAAQRHLYKLAESADWQIMMTTHSPYFVNPLEDHSTIVRLERDPDVEDAVVVPRTYRSDSISFGVTEKDRLQALQHIDPSLAEIFFGSYPILVEGDTEHAAFIAAVIESQDALIERVTVVRARGKAILVPIIKMLTHFKINFGVIHDSDSPYRKNGSINGMWTENEKIYESIKTAHGSGILVRHRVSVPNFEKSFGLGAKSREKPLSAYLQISKDETKKERMRITLFELLEGEQSEPLSAEQFAGGETYIDVLKRLAQRWAAENGRAADVRYFGSTP